MVQREVERPAKVFHERLAETLVVVKGNGLMQDGGVAGFPDIGGGAEDQPQGIVVESAAHVKVAAPGERLVLVIGAAIG